MAKRISELPSAITADGFTLVGNQGGMTKKMDVGLIGEQWEDITSLFTVNSANSVYTINNDNLFELIRGIPLRITIELFTFTTAAVGDVSGTIQLYVTQRAGTSMSTFLQANSLRSSSDNTFTGTLGISNDAINYYYSVDILDELTRPKILKVERLTGVN